MAKLRQIRARQSAAKKVVPQPTFGPPAQLVPFPSGLVSFSSGKERCGINEYSRGLAEEMRRAAAISITEVRLDDIALASSAPAGAEVLVHAEPSLLRPGFIQALGASHKRGAKIVVCLHYCDSSFFHKFANVADIVVVHRAYGIQHPKLRQVPLACPLYQLTDREALRAKFGFTQPVVTTFGFLTAWKRFADVAVRLLPELKRRGALFQMICPAHFSGVVDGEYQNLRAAVGRFPETARWISEFSPEAEILDRVSASDLGVMYHAHDTGSCSAASKMFVSTRRPLLVTSSNHDSDIRSADRISGCSLSDFTRRALELLDDAPRRAQLASDMERDYERMNMRAVAARYLELFKEIKK